MNSKAIHKGDMRNLKKVVCILVGLDFEDRLFPPKMFTPPFDLHSHSLLGQDKVPSLPWRDVTRAF